MARVPRSTTTSLKRERLPGPKEETIGRYRTALEHHRVAIGGWPQRQRDLCLIGIVAVFGWDTASVT